MDVQDIISEKLINKVHGNANFGGTSPRDVVNFGVLKCACGYEQGSSATGIIKTHGLVAEVSTYKGQNVVTQGHKLTSKGKEYLWAAFGYK